MLVVRVIDVTTAILTPLSDWPSPFISSVWLEHSCRFISSAWLGRSCYLISSTWLDLSCYLISSTWLVLSCTQISVPNCSVLSFVPRDTSPVMDIFAFIPEGTGNTQSHRCAQLRAISQIHEHYCCICVVLRVYMILPHASFIFTRTISSFDRVEESLDIAISPSIWLPRGIDTTCYGGGSRSYNFRAPAPASGDGTVGW